MPRQPYFDHEGKPVPGVTDVLNRLAKPALVRWARKLGAEGKSLDAERTLSKSTGTYGHALITQHLGGEHVPDGLLDELACEEPLDGNPIVRLSIEQGGRAMLDGLRAWHSASGLTVLSTEESLVSGKYGVGGTFDALMADPMGGPLIYDWKGRGGGKAGSVYAEAVIQVSAYAFLYEDVTGIEIAGAGVLSLPTTLKKNGGLRKRAEIRLTREELDTPFRVFRALLEVHNLMPQVDDLLKDGKQ